MEEDLSIFSACVVSAENFFMIMPYTDSTVVTLDHPHVDAHVFGGTGLGYRNVCVANMQTHTIGVCLTSTCVSPSVTLRTPAATIREICNAP